MGHLQGFCHGAQLKAGSGKAEAFLEDGAERALSSGIGIRSCKNSSLWEADMCYTLTDA